MTGLAFCFVMAWILFLIPNREVYQSQATETRLIFSDLNLSDLGYLPIANPYASQFKNQETSSDGDIRLGLYLPSKGVDLEEKQLLDLSHNLSFNSILSQIHPSHFYF